MTMVFAIALWLAVEAAAIAVVLADRRTRKQQPKHEVSVMQANDGPGMKFVCLVKGDERYIFLYSDTAEKRTLVLRTLGRFASNSELSLTWGDCAVLAQRIQQNR